MTTVDDGLIIHYMMKGTSTDGLIENAAGGQDPGGLGGAPSFVQDAQFGSVLELGARQFVRTSWSKKVTDRNFSVAAWVFVPEGAYAAGSQFAIFTAQAAKTQVLLGLQISPTNRLEIYGEDPVGNWDSRGMNNGALGRWIHVSYCISEASTWLYIDGAPKHQRSGDLRLTTPVRFFFGNRAPVALTGRMVSARVYDRALTQAEVAQLFQQEAAGGPPAGPAAGMAGPAVKARSTPFRQGNPLAFELLDSDDQPAIYVVDHPLGPDDAAFLTIQNAWRDPVYVLPSDTMAANDPDNYHFRLQFRAGALSRDSLQSLALDPRHGDGGEWIMSKPNAVRGAPWVSVLLRYTGSKTVALTSAPDDPGIDLRITRVSADPTGGSRGTHVRLDCNERLVTYDALGQSGVRESSRNSVNVVNHRGKKHLPAYFGYAGPTANRVVNDGDTSNRLRLRMTALSDLRFSKDAKLKLAIDAGDTTQEWTLGTDAQVNAITVAVNNGPEIRGITLGQASGFTIGQDRLGSGLAANGFIDIVLDNITTAHPAGPALLRVTCSGMGYWDETFVCPIEKTPLIYYQENGSQHVSIEDSTLRIEANSANGEPAIAVSQAGNELAGWFHGGRGVHVDGITGTSKGLLIEANSSAQALEVRQSGPGLTAHFSGGTGLRIDGNTDSNTAAIYVNKTGAGMALQIEANNNSNIPALFVNQTGGGFAAIFSGGSGVGITGTTDGTLLKVTGRIEDKSGEVMPVGAILPFAGSIPPRGWLLCNGMGFPTTTYPDLFSVIQYTYTDRARAPAGFFQVPDFRFRAPVGYVEGAGQAFSMGFAGGEAAVVLQVPHMPPHNHVDPAQPAYSRLVKVGEHTHTGSTDSTGASEVDIEEAVPSVSVGNGLAHNNMQPYLVVNFIIRF